MNEGGLLLIGEITSELLAKCESVPGFLAMFDIIRVEPLANDEIQSVVNARAASMNLVASDDALKRVTEVCEQFLSTSDGPLQPLKLLERIKHYKIEKSSIEETEPVSPQFVEKVFSIYSGLPQFVINSNQALKVNDIRSWFRERVIGQEVAIEAVVESIVMLKAAINDPGKPLGAFMFVGPTGVGKTELAKALATYLFGSERRLLRFDLSEFSDYNSFKMLIGDPDRPNTPARLTEPVRLQPFQVVLFDELEKGHLNIRDLLLQILDEGRLSDSAGRTVNFRNTFFIVTSNVGAANVNKNSIGFGDGDTEADKNERLREGLETFFRPEFLNRFQQIVPFHALKREHVECIVRKEISLVLSRRGISERNIAVDFSDSLIKHVSENGYDVRYGARALKREIERQVVMPIATILSEQNVLPGSILKLDISPPKPNQPSRNASTSIRMLNTEQSIAHAKDTEPVKGPDGKTTTRAALLAQVSSLRKRINAISQSLENNNLTATQSALEKQRQDPEFWADIDIANSVIQQLDALSIVTRRIDQLNDSLEQIADTLTPQCGRRVLTISAKRLFSLDQQVTVAHRELITLGAVGCQDALVEISQLSGKPLARDVLFNLYRNWTHSRGYKLELLSEPLANDEPVMFSIAGDYSYGYLHLENGIHRFRDEQSNVSSVRVRTTAWTDEKCEPEFESRTALKKTGQLDGRVRSRSVVSEPVRLVLQNEHTLEKNRDIAARFAMSWLHRTADIDENVRRYDDSPFMVKDLLTNQTFNRRDCLKPAEMHALFCARIDLV